MTQAKRLVGFAAAAAVVTIAVYFGTRERLPGPGAGAERVESDESPAANAPAVAAVDRVDEQRTSVEALPRLLSIGGAPVANATLERLPLPSDLATTIDRTPLGIDWEALDERVTRAVTSQDGSFTPPRPLDGDEARSAAVWIAHADFESTVVIRESAEPPIQDWPALRPATASRVVVVDGTGAPVPDARVSIFHARGGVSSARDEQLAAALRLRRKDLVTDDAGTATFSWSRHAAVGRASHGGHVSAWTPLELGAETIIQLEPSFTLQVRIESEDGTRLGTNALLRVWSESGDRRFLASQPVKSLGIQPDLQLPLVDARELVVALTGEAFAGQTEVLSMPLVNTTRNATFKLLPGAAAAFVVQTESATPISSAEVTLTWDESLGSSGPKTSSGRTSEAGEVRLTGPREGRATVGVVADGFRMTMTEILLPQAEPLVITLLRGTTVRGLLVDQAGPVTATFRVNYWEQGDTETTRGEWFTSGDGTFVINDAPVGEIAFTARSLDSPPSTVSIVQVPPEGLEDLELALPEAITASGRVVDALTSESVEGALVYQFAATNAELIEAIGVVGRTDEAGRFEIASANAAVTGFGVVAEGFGEHYDIRSDLVGPEADLGVITLFPRRDLTVRLVHDGSVDTSGYRAWASPGTTSDPVSFDATGVAIIEGARFGWQNVKVSTPDGTVLEQNILLSDLEPGAPWEATFPLTNRSFDLTVLAGEGVQLESLTVRGTFRAGPAHRSSVRAGIEILEDRLHAAFENLPESPGADAELAIEVVDKLTGKSLASSAVNLATQTACELLVDGRSFEVELVDAAGDPLPGADICAMTEDSDNAWQLLVKTDGEGIARLPIAGLQRVLIHVFDRTAGHKHGIPFDLTAGERRLRIALDSLTPLDVIVLHGQTPVEALRAVLFHPSHPVSVSVATSNSLGELRFERLTPDAYDLQIRHPQFWPVDERITHAAAAQRHEVQVHPLADLDLQLFSSTGIGLPDQTVSLISVDLAESVAAWLAAGLVEGQLTTDATGRMQLEGLPSGAYRLEFTPPGSSVILRDLDLRPGPNRILL